MGDAHKVATFDEMKAFENQENVLIIDVRDPSEIKKTGTIGGSINIPLSQLEAELENSSEEVFQDKFHKPKPPKNFPIIFSCMMGGRAAKALALAEGFGFNNVRYYKGSWKEWEEKLKGN